jgi:ABC-type transporter Mla MlaB component
MLRITQIAGQNAVPQLKVEGKLVGPWVGELKQVCGRLCESTDQLRLDLSAVSFVDAPGLQLLRDLIRRGITLAACSGLIAELLHVESR